VFVELPAKGEARRGDPLR